MAGMGRVVDRQLPTLMQSQLMDSPISTAAILSRSSDTSNLGNCDWISGSNRPAVTPETSSPMLVGNDELGVFMAERKAIPPAPAALLTQVRKVIHG